MKNELIHQLGHFDTYSELIEWAAEKYGDRIAYSCFDPASSGTVKKSFKELRRDVLALTAALGELGVGGRHCVVCGKLSYEWVLTYFSIVISGGVIVPIDRDWQPNELAKTSKKANAELLFIEPGMNEKAEAVSSEVKLIESPITLDENGIGALIARGNELLLATPDKKLENAPRTQDISIIVFTSGTTGEGKGVMLTEAGVLDDLCAVVPYIDFADKTIGVLPPHHTYGSSVIMVGHVMIGCEVYISRGLRYIQKELREQKPGHLVLVPLYLESFYRKILASVKEQGKERLLSNMIKLSNFLLKLKIDLRKKLFASVRAAFGGELKMVISGGAPINSEIIDFFEAIGISTLNGYGITECSPIISVNRSRRNVKGSVGPVLSVNHVKIDEPNADGEGEILVKGSNVMLGYYENPEATADAFDCEGYFRTGDYGRLDGDVLTITGRKKNLIILSNGKNVYPEEIESDLIATPGISEIVVYEGESRRGLEHNAIVAEIYPDKDYMEKNGITDVKAHLSKYIDEYNKSTVPYKKIAILKIRDEEFPKNTLRKIMRFKLDRTID